MWKRFLAREVSFMCSPMEADWQLVALEEMGWTVGSMTEDGE